MKTADSFREALAKIEAGTIQPKHESGHYTIRLSHSSPCLTRAGLTMPGRLPLLIFEVPPAALKSNKLEMETEGLVCHLDPVLHGGNRSIEIQIRATNSAFSDLFKEVAPDLIHVVSRSENVVAAMKALAGRLDLWRRFMDAKGHDGLSDQQVTGLFGELTLINLALDHGRDPVAVLQSWTGPFSSNQDFTHCTSAIEVKTSCSNEPGLIKISNLRQLDPTGLLQLYLFHAVFDRRRGSGVTLPDLVYKLGNSLKNHSEEAWSLFQNALLASGYLAADSKLYEQFGFTERFFKSFSISDRFPRLTESDIREGVISATYTIDLAAADSDEIKTESMLDIYK